MTYNECRVVVLKIASVLLRGKGQVPCHEEDLPKSTPKSVIAALYEQHDLFHKFGVDLALVAKELSEHGAKENAPQD